MMTSRPKHPESTLFRDARARLENLYLQQIVNVVACYYQIDPAVLFAKHGEQRLCEIRFLCCHLCERLTGLSLSRLAQFFERDPSQISFCVIRFAELAATDPEYKAMAESLAAKLRVLFSSANFQLPIFNHQLPIPSPRSPSRPLRPSVKTQTK